MKTLKTKLQENGKEELLQNQLTEINLRLKTLRKKGCIHFKERVGIIMLTLECERRVYSSVLNEEVTTLKDLNQWKQTSKQYITQGSKAREGTLKGIKFVQELLKEKGTKEKATPLDDLLNTSARQVLSRRGVGYKALTLRYEEMRAILNLQYIKRRK